MVTGLLFERLWLLGLVMVGLSFVMIGWWSWRRSLASARALKATLIAFPLLMLLSHLVVTDGEQMIETCNALAAAVRGDDMATIERHLSDELSVAGMDRDRFLDQVTATLTRYDVVRARLKRFNVEHIASGVGAVTFVASASIRTKDDFAMDLPTRWRVTFQREGDVWMVIKLKTIAIPPLNIGDVQALMSR